MKNRGIILSLAVAVILLALITPAIGIDHPVEPFQKAKALALKEGTIVESKAYGKKYVLPIEEWGGILYVPQDGTIMLWTMKGSPDNYISVEYYGKTGKYHVGRQMAGGKQEITDVDWSVAMDIANKCLREIEAVRGK